MGSKKTNGTKTNGKTNGKNVKLVYEDVELRFKVNGQAKTFKLSENGKSLNFAIFSPTENSGILVSRKGVYLPANTVKQVRKAS